MDKFKKFIILNNLIKLCLIVNFLSTAHTLDETFERTNLCLAANDHYFKHEIFKCMPINRDAKPSYRCACKYEKNRAKSPVVQIDNCIEVHPGMAVKGFNLVYHQWLNKEHCLNLCLKTTIKNGNTFDCVSFEHWHSDCTYEHLFIKTTTTTTTLPTTENENNYNYNSNSNQHHGSNLTSKSCNDFTEHNLNLKGTITHLHEKNLKRTKSKKIDLCVLSNQTINTAGNHFEFNYAVTYYEILCNRTHSDTTKLEEINKETVKSEITTKKIQIELKTISQTTSTIMSTTSNTSISQLTTTIRNGYQTCDFNPCLNNATCINDNQFRFHCLCLDFYYGIFCQQKAIEISCNSSYMNIYIAKELAAKLQIRLSHIYVNDKENSLLTKSYTKSMCKSKNHNQTHVRFQISFNNNKCGTKKKIHNSQTIFSNNLYSLKPIHNKLESSNGDSIIEKTNENHLIMSAECVFNNQDSSYDDSINKVDGDNDDVYYNENEVEPRRGALIYNNTEKNVEINDHTTSDMSDFVKPKCITDVLNTEIRFYADPNYDLDLIKSSANLNSQSTIKINNDATIYIEILILYSDESYKLFKMLDLKNTHLTINSFWLSSVNESEYFIVNGCPNEKVNFYDTLIKKKKALRFSINSNLIKSTSSAHHYHLDHKKQPIYFHSRLEICTDKLNEQLNIISNNYTKLINCETINSLCSKSAFSMQQDTNDLLLNSCHLSLNHGPFYIQTHKKPPTTTRQLIKTPTTTIKQNNKNHQTITNSKVKSNGKSLRSSLYSYYYLLTILMASINYAHLLRK